MAKRRIAQVVRQTGCGHDLPYLLKQRVAQLRAALNDTLSHIVAKRHSHAGNLQRVCQSVVYEDASRQGEHLRLVLQASERCRENQSVIVTLKLRAVVVPFHMAVLLPQPLIRYQLFPVHHIFFFLLTS